MLNFIHSSGQLKNKLSPTALFIIPTFFYFLAERAISYVFPIITQHIVDSNFIVGIVMSLSSIFSVLCDLYLPSVLKSRTWRMQLSFGILTCVGLPLLIFAGQTFNSLFLILIGSFFWAISFEIHSFSLQNFITEEIPRAEFSRTWGIIYVVTQLVTIAALFGGPSLLEMSSLSMCLTIILIQAFGLISAIAISIKIKKHHKIVEEVLPERPMIHLHLRTEFRYWRIFWRRLYPVIIVGVWAGVIDAVFWTYGGLLGEELNITGVSSALILILYVTPSILSMLFMARVQIVSHKKRYSHIALLLAGMFLVLIAFYRVSPLFLFVVVLMLGLILSVVWPLNNAVYSDLLGRTNDKSQQHLVGLSKANDSLSYLLGPIIAGWLIDRSSYVTVFAGMGVVTVIIAVFLIVATPRKLKIPQRSLESLN